jgi:hypothetical protein
MSQLFHAITSMQAINLTGVYHVQMQSVLELLGTFTDGYPKFRMEKIGNGEYQWSMEYPRPIPLTDVVEESNPLEEGEEGTPA